MNFYLRKEHDERQCNAFKSKNYSLGNFYGMASISHTILKRDPVGGAWAELGRASALCSYFFAILFLIHVLLVYFDSGRVKSYVGRTCGRVTFSEIN